MKIQMNMNMMAAACIVVGLAGALSSAGGSQAAAASDEQQGRAERSSDLCSVAASFETDSAGRNFAKALRGAIGCSQVSTRT